MKLYEEARPKHPEFWRVSSSKGKNVAQLAVHLLQNLESLKWNSLHMCQQEKTSTASDLFKSQ